MDAGVVGEERCFERGMDYFGEDCVIWCEVFGMQIRNP